MGFTPEDPGPGLSLAASVLWESLSGTKIWGRRSTRRISNYFPMSSLQNHTGWHFLSDQSQYAHRQQFKPVLQVSVTA